MKPTDPSLKFYVTFFIKNRVHLLFTYRSVLVILFKPVLEKEK